MLSVLETDAYDCGGFDALYFSGLVSFGLTSAASCYLCSCITSGIIRSKFNFNDRLDFFKVLFNSDGNLFVPSKIFNCDALFKVVMFYPLNSNWVDSFSLRVPWDYFFFKIIFVFFFLPKVDWVCFKRGESYLSYWRIISCILFSVLDKLGSTFTFFALNYGTFRSNFFTFVGFGLSDFRTLGLELCVILKLRYFRVSDSVIIFRGLEFFTETAPLTTASLVFVVSKLFYMVSLIKQGDSVIGIVSVLFFWMEVVSVLILVKPELSSVNMILFFWKPELS